MNALEMISEALEQGKAMLLTERIEQAIKEGFSERQVIDDGLLTGINRVSALYERNEVFVPEVLIASRALSIGLDYMETRHGRAAFVEPLGRVVLATVKGDMHDIGKNLVGMMLRKTGFQVFDLGVNVSEYEIADAVLRYNADLVALSALLTTTMAEMACVIEELTLRGMRERVILMIGGAPVTQEYANAIGADIYTSNAANCATEAKRAILAKRAARGKDAL